jgi:hypothetical protein
MGNLEAVSLDTIDALERQAAKLQAQLDMRERKSIFDAEPRKPPVRRGPRPEEPPACLCEKCGEMLWRVVGPNGRDLRIDRYQIETLAADGDIIREPLAGRSKGVQRVVQGIGGYQLLKPEWFSGCSLSGEEASWMWFANAMSLVDAEVLQEPIYSDHKLTCEQASTQAIIAAATNVALEGDAAGDRAGKRGMGQTPEMKASKILWLKLPSKYLAARTKPTAIKRKPTKAEVEKTLFSELPAWRDELARQAKETVQLEAAQSRQLTLWS